METNKMVRGGGKKISESKKEGSKFRAGKGEKVRTLIKKSREEKKEEI